MGVRGWRALGQFRTGLAIEPGDEFVDDPRPLSHSDQCAEGVPASLGHADWPVRRVGARVLGGHGFELTRGCPRQTFGVSVRLVIHRVINRTQEHLWISTQI